MKDVAWIDMTKTSPAEGEEEAEILQEVNLSQKTALSHNST